jgi:hypothetical protein
MPFSPTTHQITPSGIEGADLTWLLTVEWDGFIYRWSSQPLTVLDADGVEVHFEGGLDATDIQTAVSFLSDSTEAPSASFEVFWPSDVALEISQGRDLSSARGELSIIPTVKNTVPEWSSRVPLVAGTLLEPTYGAADDPVAFSIESTVAERGELWPPASAVVSVETWPEVEDTDSEGEGYPFIFGSPGVISGSTVVPATPAIPVEWTSDDVDTLVVAGHPVDAASVRLYYQSTTTGEWYYVTPSVSTVEDGLGREVSTVTITGLPTAVTQADGYAVCWYDGSDPVFGMRGAKGPLRTAADVLGFMLGLTPAGLDLEAWGAIREALGGIQIGGYIDEQVQPWEWVSDNLLPVLPISLLGSPSGVKPVLWRYDAIADEAVVHLRAEPGRLVRTGPVTYTGRSDEIINDVRVSYAYDMGRGEYGNTMQVCPDPVGSSASSSSWARRSQNRFNRIGSETIETDVVYSEATAQWVASWRVAAGAFPRRVLTYDAHHDLAWLPVGSVVALTDEELHLAGKVGLLTSKSWTDTGIINLTLELLEHGD